MSPFRSYLRLMVVELLSNGKQPPMRNPSATLPANTSPQGISIDFHTTKLMLTKLAFWTDIRAMRTIQIAVIVETITFTISVQRIKVKTVDLGYP